MLYTLLIIAAVAIAALAWLLRGWWGGRNFVSRANLARATLATERERLNHEFLQAARATGKPRGLTWVDCNFQEGALFAFDRASGDIYALRGVTIRFEAIPGGGMEEVEAVSNLRYGTAVFAFRNKTWTTEGRTIFNLSPQESLEKYRDSLAPLAT